MLLATTVAASNTVVPTWLAILVPVLVALASDAGGLIGAMLGSQATRRVDRRKWARERREPAYLTWPLTRGLRRTCSRARRSRT